MAIISFIGLVTAWQPKPRHAYQLIICCMARTGPKMYHPISLEGDFTPVLPDFTPEIGSYVYGEAQILQVWDGSILVEFMKDKFQTIASDACQDFNGELLPYVHSPRADRNMCLIAKDFYRLRLSPEYYPNQLNWNVCKRPFGRLAPYLLAKAGDSMAKIEGHGVFITKIKYNKAIDSLRNCAFEINEVCDNKKLTKRKNSKNHKEKFALFLLAGIAGDNHNPTFMISRMENGYPLKQGQTYHFKELPLLAVEDDMREEESTIFCGKGTFQAAQHIWKTPLLQLYNDLGNCERMPVGLWNKYFSGKLERAAIRRLQKEIGDMIIAKGIEIPKRIYGWWYYWEPIFNLNVPFEEEIVVLAPAFRDGGPARVIIVPLLIYENKKFRKDFSLYSSAVSVCENPEIIEGNFRPEPETWTLLKNWIIKNRLSLEKDAFEIDDDVIMSLRSPALSHADVALKKYEKSGSEILPKIINAFTEGKFRGEEHKILPIIEKEAEQGNSSAQRVLAEAFLYGRGKPKDIEQAIFWLEKAVNPKGRKVSYDRCGWRIDGRIEFIDVDPRAQYLLAQIKEKAGGEENIRQAVRLYAESANTSFIASYYELGRICEKGIGIPQNLPAAVYWYRSAYTKGGIYGRVGLDEKSKMAYEQIVSQMGEKSWETVSAYYLLAPDPRDFLYTWILAETGIADYQYKLGMLLLNDLSIPKDIVGGTKWLKKAVAQGYFRAYYQLGMSYYLGEGVGKDFEKAAELFRKGAELGHNEACYALGYLYQEGKGVLKNIELARHWYHKALDAHFPPNDHCEDKGYKKAEEALKNLFYPSLTREGPKLIEMDR